MLGLSKARELRSQWQRAAELLLGEADIATLSGALELAPFYDAKLDESFGEMKTRTRFAHRIDMLDAAREIQEHLAGVEDYELAEATWQAAIARWPKAVIILR